MESCKFYQNLTLYPLLCHCVHWWLVDNVQCLSVPQNEPSLGSVLMLPLVSCKFCPLSLCAPLCTFCWFRVIASDGNLYIPSTVCQYLTMFRLLFPCHCIHWYLELPVSTSHFTVGFFCVTASTGVLQSLFSVCQYLTMYLLLVSVSLRPLVTFKVCPMPVSVSQFTVCSFHVPASNGVLYNLCNVFQCLTLYRQLVLCHRDPS